MPYLDYASDLPAGQDVQAVLAQANGFTKDDLAQNREGRLTNRQMLRMLGRALKPPRGALIVMGLWALLVFAVRTYSPAVALRLAEALGADRIGVPGAIGLTGLITGALAAIPLVSRKSLLMLMDIARGRTAEATGRIYPSFEEEESGALSRLRQDSGRSYYYVIQRERFEVSAEGHASTPTGVLCRVFFAPSSRVLLSVEVAATSLQEAAHAEAFTWKPAGQARSATAK